MKKLANFNEYILNFPENAQYLLEQMRTIINTTAPTAEEIISYGMPAFKLNGYLLVWFAGYKNHIGFYPKASGIAAFKKELSNYKNAKGSVQFPIDKKLPVALIKRIVKFRMGEILQSKPKKK